MKNIIRKRKRIRIKNIYPFQKPTDIFHKLKKKIFYFNQNMKYVNLPNCLKYKILNLQSINVKSDENNKYFNKFNKYSKSQFNKYIINVKIIKI